MKILLAEDESILRNALTKQLTHQGYEVLSVCDGREALNEFEKFFPDFIITDILMPFSSGLELIGVVRSTTLFKKIPILVLSGMGQESTVMEAFNLGADDYIIKPFNFKDLLERIHQLTKRKAVL